jgi:hypothetical protein
MHELQEIGADLYRANAFRVLGLNASARLKQAKRRAAMLVAMIDSGDQESLEAYVEVKITDAPDEPAVRAASHRLESPEARLRDEVFWFRDADSEALDLQDAILLQTWLEQEFLNDEEGETATHNLAVFFHLIALEIEAEIASGVRSELYPAYSADAQVAWGEALRRWQHLAKSDAFGTWLSERIETVGATRLDEQTQDVLKDLARFGPLSQIVTLAFDYGRDDRPDDTNRLRNLAINGGYSEDDVNSAAETVLQDRADKLLQSLEAERMTIDADPETAAEKADNLMDRAFPDIDAMAALLGGQNAIVSSLGDAIAQTVNRAQIEVSDKLNDPAKARALLGRVQPYAKSDDVVHILKKNMSFLTCQFCERRTKEDDCAYPFTLCRIQSGTPFTGQVNYQHMTLDVPRCGICQKDGRGGDKQARQYHEIVQLLEQGWLPRRQPTDADIDAFFARNG